MESISLIFAIFGAILVSGVVVRVIPGVPLPLIQITLGFLLAGVFQEGLTLNPDIFFLIFLPPLLFLDGWRIPKDALKRDRFGIFHLAFGLVIITVLGLGYLMHWMIPSMPLPVAFALAAIVSPTDPVAVAGIGRRLAIPSRVMAILEGEALFNDASGLVAFRMAVLAMMTGAFSIYSAATSFLWLAIAGVITGVTLTWLLSFFRSQFTKKYGEELGAEILLSLLIPFAAYAVAEYIEASGILAAVAAGLTMSRLELSGAASPITRMRRNAMWDTIQFTLNGMMFILLGEQLPGIFQGAVQVVEETGHRSPWWLIIYAIVICIVLAIFRFSWVFLSIHLARFIRRTPTPLENKTSIRDISILAIGGVRGAVTLAGVLTLPLLLPTKEIFPARDLAIFLAATVIIISLLIASIGLPLILKGGEKENKMHSPLVKQKHFAINQAMEAASKQLDALLLHQEKNDFQLDETEQRALKARLLLEFENSFGINHTAENPSYQHYLTERAMRLAIIDAARTTVYRLARDNKISDELARDIGKQLDYDQIRFN